jgi:hypothetical protein
VQQNSCRKSFQRYPETPRLHNLELHNSNKRHCSHHHHCRLKGLSSRVHHIQQEGIVMSRLDTRYPRRRYPLGTDRGTDILQGTTSLATSICMHQVVVISHIMEV